MDINVYKDSFKSVNRTISIPKKDRDVVDKVCKKLGMKVSHFYVIAVREWIANNCPEFVGELLK